jgi:membrane AbrB-like protein
MPAAPPQLARLFPYLLGLGFGTVGGALFAWLKLPLPWMLGAMTAGLLGALFGLPLKGPAPLAAPMRAVLGVLLGASFTPELVARAGELAASLGFVLPYVVLSAALAIPYLRLVAGFDFKTAYFAAMPGGLNDMITLAHEAGADERRVALTHGARILLIVFAVPFLIEWVGGLDIDRSAAAAVGLNDLPWREVVLLVACGVVGWFGAARLRLPGPTIIGPMLVSATVHLLGWSTAKPPDLLVALAQLILGTLIGSRFAGVRPAEVLRILGFGVGLAVVLLAVTFLFTSFLPGLIDQEPMGVFLAFAPGGLAETTLIALALGIETAYVAVHHVLRIVLVIALAPWVFRLVARWRHTT